MAAIHPASNSGLCCGHCTDSCGPLGWPWGAKGPGTLHPRLSFRSEGTESKLKGRLQRLVAYPGLKVSIPLLVTCEV